MRIKTVAVVAAALAGASLLYLLTQATPPTGAAASPPPQPTSAPAEPAPELPPALAAKEDTNTKIAQLAATIPEDGDDGVALERLHKELKFTTATQVLAAVKTRHFPERERGIYYALSDKFAALATRAEIAQVADAYRQMPAGDTRDDVANLLRGITRRDLLGPLATIVKQSVQPGVREPALLAAATYAIARMATPPETELLIRAATQADTEQLADLKEGLRVLKDRKSAPLLIEIATGKHALSHQETARTLSIGLLSQVPDENGRDALLSLSKGTDTAVAEAANYSLESLRQTAPSLFLIPKP